MLKDSLFLVLVTVGTEGGPAHKELEKLAVRHDRNHLDIKPEWYVNWIDALLHAVSEHDPEYSPEVDAAWRAALADGIELLKSKYYLGNVVSGFRAQRARRRRASPMPRKPAASSHSVVGSGMRRFGHEAVRFRVVREGREQDAVDVVGRGLCQEHGAAVEVDRLEVEMQLRPLSEIGRVEREGLEEGFPVCGRDEASRHVLGVVGNRCIGRDELEV